MAEVEIGMGKSGRRAYGFDDIAIVPSRRTRDPEDVDISWEIDAFRFELPLMASAMDGVVSPATAIEIGRLGGVGVLNLEGLWTRYEDPEPLLRRDRRARQREGHGPDAGDLPGADQARARRASASARSRTPASSAAARSPRSAPTSCAKEIIDAELDLLVIQGTVVSAEHVSKTVEPLNLKRFVRELDIPVIVGGCASYQAALHLMRTGAAGVLVGVGPGHACTTRGVLGIGVPQATAIADAQAARMRHLDETGVYVPRHRRRRHGHRRRHRQGHRLRRRRRHDRLAARRRPRGPRPWATTGAWPPSTPRCPAAPGCSTNVRGTLEEILVGPAHENDGRMNLFGALRTSMATCGYETVKEFQKAEVMVAPALQTEGKNLQKSQGVGMGH